MTARRAWLACEPVLVMLAIIAASWWLYLFGRAASPWIARHYDDLNTALFLYVPLLPILLGRGPKGEVRPELSDYGLSLTTLPRALAVFAATLALVFPAYLVVMWVASQWGPSWFHPHFELHVPHDAVNVAIFHLLQVALPEEFFFRAYAQGRLDQAFTGRVRVLGADVGWGLVWANALFALAHPLQVGPHLAASWWRLETFIPGMLFGWLRARTGNLAAPLLMHWASNLMLFSVIQGG